MKHNSIDDSRQTWSFIPDSRVVNLETRTVEHQGRNWGMQMIDDCSLELCIATLSVASSGIAPRKKKLNSTAWLFRDGFIRKYQFTLHLNYITFQHYGKHAIILVRCLVCQISTTDRGNQGVRKYFIVSDLNWTAASISKLDIVGRM